MTSAIALNHIRVNAQHLIKRGITSKSESHKVNESFHSESTNLDYHLNCKSLLNVKHHAFGAGKELTSILYNPAHINSLRDRCGRS
jgi:hypothetical protein